ncbi:MAG TPA: MFS transporter [Syntrophorhabdaceae bacterium]|nr:MFS transporter [Syntrophorhabdaceae bacterium]HQM79988.1 MFS transporter [Syntrophorhabdaceae bacterium]
MNNTTASPAGLLSKEFIALNGIFFVAACTTAAFFQFQQHLQKLGIDPAWAGFIIGADSLAAFIIQPVLSPFLHRGNARKWMLIGTSGMIAALFLYGNAATIHALISVRILHGAAFITLVAALVAMIVDFIPPEKSGQGFSFLSLVRLLPYAMVPPLVSFLDGRSLDLPSVLTYAAFIMFIPLMLIFFLRTSFNAIGKDAHAPQRINLSELKEDLRSRDVIILLAVNLLLYTSYTIAFFFLKGFGALIGIGNPGFFFTIATATMIMIRLGGAAFFDKTNKSKVTSLSLAGLGLCNIGLGHTQGEISFFILSILFGICWGIVMPILTALMFDVSPSRFRGLNVNLSLVMLQAGFFFGPFLGGIVLAHSGYVLLFYCCALLSFLSAALTWEVSKP